MPVIVVGGSTTALSVQRLVAKLGHPVFAACTSASAAARTRHYRPLPSTSQGRWYGELGEKGYTHLRALPFDRAIIIPSSDEDALWLASLPSDLRDRYRVSCSSASTMRLLQDKGEFATVAADHGVACPSSFLVTRKSELFEFLFQSSNEYFFKPLNSQSFNRRFGVKALSFSDRATALRLWDEYDLGSVGVLIQEYVPGGADQHYFIDGFRDRHGEVIARLARRRIRMHPPDFGNSSLCRNIDRDTVDAAWTTLDSLLRAISYHGIFSAEFKRDSRDGSFRLIEINTRPWVYIQFADECGVNMCDLYIRDALEEELVPLQGTDADKLCVNLLADFRALRNLPAYARPSVASVLSVWFRSFKLLFDWLDLRPAIDSVMSTIGSRIKVDKTGSKSIRGIPDTGGKPNALQ